MAVAEKEGGLARSRPIANSIVPLKIVARGIREQNTYTAIS